MLVRPRAMAAVIVLSPFSFVSCSIVFVCVCFALLFGREGFLFLLSSEMGCCWAGRGEARVSVMIEEEEGKRRFEGRERTTKGRERMMARKNGRARI